jgi:hypothetical protein
MSWIDLLLTTSAARTCEVPRVYEVHLGKVARRMKGRSVPLVFELQGPSAVLSIHANLGRHGVYRGEGCVVESIVFDGGFEQLAGEAVSLEAFAGLLTYGAFGRHASARKSVKLVLRRSHARKGVVAMAIVRSRNGLRTRTYLRENEPGAVSRNGKLGVTLSVLEQSL